MFLLKTQCFVQCGVLNMTRTAYECVLLLLVYLVCVKISILKPGQSLVPVTLVMQPTQQQVALYGTTPMAVAACLSAVAYIATCRRAGCITRVTGDLVLLRCLRGNLERITRLCMNAFCICISSLNRNVFLFFAGYF